MGLFRKVVNYFKSHIIILVIILMCFSWAVNIGLSLFFDNGIALALPDYKLANTQWVCEIEEDGEIQTLTLEFNSNGTILASRERGYELVKSGLKWRKHDYATIDGENHIVAGYVYKIKRSGDTLTIVETAGFSGAILEEWTCTPLADE